uniref:Uncharacterized protein n=1 Tax=Arundo donax TaxID=35708 RepID=A0A0A9BHV5_ARUDO
MPCCLISPETHCHLTAESHKSDQIGESVGFLTQIEDDFFYLLMKMHIFASTNC